MVQKFDLKFKITKFCFLYFGRFNEKWNNNIDCKHVKSSNEANLGISFSTYPVVNFHEHYCTLYTLVDTISTKTNLPLWIIAMKLWIQKQFYRCNSLFFEIWCCETSIFVNSIMLCLPSVIELQKVSLTNSGIAEVNK